jgi:L-threonylcarbamoyladenylate synthase
MIVERARDVPSAVAGGGDSIALRAPSHAVARAVLRALGKPIAAPSANRFQGLSPTTADHVMRQLGTLVDLVLDAGPCDAGIESTVIDVRTPRPRLLRPGALDLPTLRTIVADIERADDALRGDELRPSPGMQARHYSPRARVVVASDRTGAERIAEELVAQGKRVGLLVVGPTACQSSALLAIRHLAPDPVAYARALFATLHALDETGVDAVVVEAVPEGDAWLAVADRIRRASFPA